MRREDQLGLPESASSTMCQGTHATHCTSSVLPCSVLLLQIWANGLADQGCASLTSQASGVGESLFIARGAGLDRSCSDAVASWYSQLGTNSAPAYRFTATPASDNSLGNFRDFTMVCATHFILLSWKQLCCARLRTRSP